MWNLNLDRIKAQLADKGGLPSIAIETGTCRGNGTRSLARHFSRVVTIELNEVLFSLAKNKFNSAEFAHVKTVHGNSAQELPQILSRLEDEAVFFFLDAHWSGDQTVDWNLAHWKGYGIDTAHLGEKGQTPSGPEQCPLYEELQAIAQHCKGPAYILIDDLKNIPPQGLGLKNNEFPGEDWSHLTRERLLSAVGSRLRQVQELTDPPQLFLSLNPPNS